MFSQLQHLDTLPPSCDTHPSVCQTHRNSSLHAEKFIGKTRQPQDLRVNVALNTSIYTSAFALKHLAQRYTAPLGYHQVKEKEKVIQVKNTE